MFHHMDVRRAMLPALRELAVTQFISQHGHGLCVPRALCAASSGCASSDALCRVSASFKDC